MAPEVSGGTVRPDVARVAGVEYLVMPDGRPRYPGHEEAALSAGAVKSGGTA